MSQMSPIAWNSWSKVLAPMRRRWALSFEKSHLYGVEVRAVGRKEQEPASALAQGFGGLLVLVRGKIVQDDHGSRRQLRRKLRADIGFKRGAVHRAFDHPGRNHAIRAQPGDEGLRIPRPERGRRLQTPAFQRPSAKAREVGFDASLVPCPAGNCEANAERGGTRAVQAGAA